jgi:hypothetical protein
MQELCPDEYRFVSAGVIIAADGTDCCYYPTQQLQVGDKFMRGTAIEIGLLTDQKGGTSEAMIQETIRDLEMSVKLSPGSYNTRQLARWKAIQEFKETGRWTETFPHAKYMYGDQDVRAAIVHETGHWIQAQIEYGQIHSHKELNALKDRYHSNADMRQQIGVTQRGMDDFGEAVAESWATYVAGKRHMVDPDMATVFDVWTGRRKWEEAWPQYAPKPRAG